MEGSKIRKVLCPVCGKFCFEPFSKEEIEEGYTIEDAFCFSCGWNYDEEQLNDNNKKTAINEMTVNERKLWYEEKIKNNPNYDYLEENKPEPIKHICPICGKYYFSNVCSYDICPYCGWQDDGSESDDCPNHIGVNGCKCNEYKKKYDELISSNPNYIWENNHKAK